MQMSDDAQKSPVDLHRNDLASLAIRRPVVDLRIAVVDIASDQAINLPDRRIASCSSYLVKEYMRLLPYLNKESQQ